jgi:hypothetical protein
MSVIWLYQNLNRFVVQSRQQKELEQIDAKHEIYVPQDIFWSRNIDK